MASSLSYPFLHFSSSPVKKKLFFIFHVLCLLIRYSSLTLPSTSSPATIAISLDKSEKLLVRRRRIVGSKRSMEAIVCVEDKQMRTKGFQAPKLRLHQFLKKSRISTTVLLGPVFLGNKGLNDVENDELPRLVYVLVRREPN
uniref:Uncharacterized protein n=1 Tax=Brassica oleracea TaxID=3712 RepID=A0A3P6DQT1_BRAOL|nr:unnamed protein product [Brassica oleracea]